MDNIKFLHISELTNKILHGQMVMTLGWIENYDPQDGGKAQLYLNDKSSTFVALNLSGCDLSDITEHTLCRVIGRYCSKLEEQIIKVFSVKSVSSWKYFTFSQILQKQRQFLMIRSEKT